MHIKKIRIENFKCYRTFDLELNPELNILVGDNEAGKSTILEAMHLALTGLTGGKHIRNELSQYFFNNSAVLEYLAGFKPGATPIAPPNILIELFFGDGPASFDGDRNSTKTDECGFQFEIKFDDKYQPEYADLLKGGELKSIPIEFYDITWMSFARDGITSRGIPVKSALIDSASNRYQNGSDVYISRIVRNFLELNEVVDVSQAHRKMRDTFMDEPSILAINKRIQATASISNKDVKLSVDLGTRNAWEGSLQTYLDNVPFHHIGKGEQSMVKTKLALANKQAQNADLLLFEEPENHLSHATLNQLIHEIKVRGKGKQIIISTHSSFVSNKLGLSNLILLNERKTLSLTALPPDTMEFFEKLTGYDTLRLVVCKKAILVEGDSDELVVQKAYLLKNGKLPIEDGIDVISVGTSFLRFLEIAEKISKPVDVVTDNDGDVAAVQKKYTNYLAPNAKPSIKILYDSIEDTGSLTTGKSNASYNYNTLEPKLLKVNSLAKLNTIFGTAYATEDELRVYMKANKTECALRIFKTTEDLKFPQYILDAIA